MFLHERSYVYGEPPCHKLSLFTPPWLLYIVKDILLLKRFRLNVFVTEILCLIRMLYVIYKFVFVFYLKGMYMFLGGLCLFLVTLNTLILLRSSID